MTGPNPSHLRSMVSDTAYDGSVHNDIIMMKNGMYRFIMNNQLFINCYKI